MTTTVEYLDLLKAKTGAPSDYALHKILGVTRSCISRYRNEQGYFDDDICLKVASILEIPEFEVILNVHAERSTNVLVKASFAKVLKQLGTVAATLLIATGLNLATPSPASAGAASAVSDASGTMYIMLNRRRTKRPKKTTKIDLSFLVRNLLKVA